MKAFEKNVQASFRMVKNDMTAAKESLAALETTNGKLKETVQELRTNQYVLHQKILALQKDAREQPKEDRKVFVAQRDGKKFHAENCPYGKNIKPRNKLTYNTPTVAMNDGLQPCTCVQ